MKLVQRTPVYLSRPHSGLASVPVISIVTLDPGQDHTRHSVFMSLWRFESGRLLPLFIFHFYDFENFEEFQPVPHFVFVHCFLSIRPKWRIFSWNVIKAVLVETRWVVGAWCLLLVVVPWITWWRWCLHVSPLQVILSPSLCLIRVSRRGTLTLCKVPFLTPPSPVNCSISWCFLPE